MNLAKGRLFAKFWCAKMNAGRNTWAASAETPKLYLPKQPFLQNFVPPILPAIRYRSLRMPVNQCVGLAQAHPNYVTCLLLYYSKSATSKLDIYYAPTSP